MAHEWEALANDPEIRPLLVRKGQDGRDVPITYMRHAERQSEAEEIGAIDRKLADPVERKFLQNPGRLKQQNDRRKQNLLAQSPPTDLRPSQRDKLGRLEALTRDFVAENMPTAEQMRHNPPGAVDHHRAWDKATKPALLTWKRVRVLRHPDSDELDLCNFERYRPAVATRNLFSDGQIPRKFALSNEAKANYDQIDWDSPDVQAQAEARGYTLVRRGTRAQGRARKETREPMAVTATCGIDGCSVAYRGPFGSSNLARHRLKAHGHVEEVSA